MSKPAVFISYARQDFGLAKKFEQALTEHGFSVWRDQESIYTGENWPKAIGEAISFQNYVLLFWSKHANKAHFVEFEWSTAIALRKPILPVLLDETDLAPSLRIYNGIPLDNFDETLSKILKSLEKRTAKIDARHEEEVFEALDELDPKKPQKAVKAVRKMIKQEAKNVKGNVYQAGGDINIGVEQKNPFLKWYYIAALLAAVLTIIKISTELIPPIWENGSDPNQIVEEQVLAGEILDEQNNPLPDVTVRLPEFNLFMTTNEHGKFEFNVLAPHQARVALRAQKEGFITKNLDPNLGSTYLNFKLEQIK